MALATVRVSVRQGFGIDMVEQVHKQSTVSCVFWVYFDRLLVFCRLQQRCSVSAGSRRPLPQRPPVDYELGTP